MRPTGHVSIREDRSVPGGGHAEVRIAGVQATADRANFHVRRLNYEKNNLGPEGWQGPEAEWTPLAVRQDGTDLVVSVGPDVVDRIEVGMPVEIEFPGLGVSSTAPWPDISPSAYSRAGRSGTPARRTRTGLVAPPPPPPPAEPEPEPAPVLVAEPPPEPPATEDDAGARTGSRGWAIALGALLFLLLAGGGAAYVLVTDDELRQRMAAWLPFLEDAQPGGEEDAVADEDEAVVEEAEPAAAPAPVAVVSEPDPPPVTDEPPEPADAEPAPEPDTAEQDDGLPCLPEPGAWEPCVAQIMSEGRPNEEVFDLAQRYLEAEDPQMAIGLYRELMTRRRLTEAVLEIGKMYDPRYYAPHTSAFSEPNAERAIRYYRQAEAAGDDTAERMLEGLRLWLEGQAENGSAEAQRLLNAQFQ